MISYIAMLRYTLNIVILLALGIWIGSLVFFGAGVASIVFSPGLLPDRTTAGALNSAILGRLGIVEIVCGVLLLAGALYMAVRGRTWMNWVVLLLGIAMLGTAAYYTNILYPQMDALRLSIGNFDHISSEKMALKEAFDQGHVLYSSLVKGVLLAGIVSLILHTIYLVRGANPRREQVPTLAPEPLLPRAEEPRASSVDRPTTVVPATEEGGTPIDTAVREYASAPESVAEAHDA